MNPETIERKRRADGERSRAAILDAAARLATVEGLEGLSIGRLAVSLTGMSIVWFLLNSGLTAVAVSLDTRTPVLQVWKRIGVLGHVAFTPADALHPPNQPPPALAIVVDVMRATSTIAQALASGYPRVYCCATPEDALTLRAMLGEGLLGGERLGQRIVQERRPARRRRTRRQAEPREHRPPDIAGRPAQLPQIADRGGVMRLR